MPKVEQVGQPRVSTQLVRGPRARNAPVTSVGGTLAQALPGAVSTFQDIQKRMATTASEEALVGFEREKNQMFFNPETGYFNTQGRDAFDNAQQANENLTALKSKYLETLDSDVAKQMFGRAADAHITRGNQDIMRHSSKGLQAWEVSTLQAQTENSIENAALYWGDDQRMRVQNALGRQAVIDAAKLQGIDGEALNERLQTYDSSFASTAISAATVNSAADGQALLDGKMGGLLEGPDKVKIEKNLAAKVKAEKTQSDAQMAVLTATNLVDTYDTRSEIIEEVNKIEDPDQRKKTMSESMQQFSRKKQAESEDRAAAFETGEDHISDGGTAESFKAQSPEEWEKLSPKQQRSLQSGKAVLTDWGKFSDLMTLPRDQLAKVDPTDHFNELAPSERSKLISAVKSANGTGSSSDKADSQFGRSRTAQTTAAVDQIFGKKTKRNQAQQAQVNAFYALVDGEARSRETIKGSKLTSEEYTSLLSDFTRQVVQEGFIFDSELDLTDVPAEDVPTLSKFLRDNGVPVTSDNLIKAWKQAQ